MKIALTTDHTGFELLKQLQLFLETQGHEYVNYGPTTFDPDDDYPEFMRAAALAVAADDCQYGLIMGGSGQGEAMAANRVKGVRCAVYYGQARAKAAVDAEGRVAADDFEIIRLSRQHNNANMLSLATRFLDFEEIQQAVKLWLDTPFSGVERHSRRVKQLDQSGA